jgi:two-component system sensor histidine kinase AlgZ
MQAASKAAAGEADDLLPDFCAGARVLRVLLVCEAVAVVLALGGPLGDNLWRRLFLFSVYLQWIGICSAGVLCMLRRHAGHWSSRRLALASYAALLAVTFIITEITIIAGRYTGFALLTKGNGHEAFVLRSLGICAVVAAMALRYFWLRSDWQRRAEAAMRARFEALQARIEPHFLFNSLNSVAALIDSRPAAAETALEDLAALLRARLTADAPAQVTLDEEMALVRAYVRIERLRLGQRLRVTIDIEPAAHAARLPALCLQPLVENAIAHGVARLAEGGTVTIKADLAGPDLWLQVSNPLAKNTPAAPGNRQALVNIKRRLALGYGDTAQLHITRDKARFSVTLFLPQNTPKPS